MMALSFDGTVPDAIGKAGESLRCAGSALETDTSLRLIPDHRGSLAQEPGNLLQDSQRKDPVRRQDQDTVLHAGAGDEPSTVIHLDTQQSILIDCIEIVARKGPCDVGMLVRKDIRHMVTVVVQGIRDEAAVLDQELNPCQILHERG